MENTKAQQRKSADDARSSRPYDGTLRRERAAETRERILDASSELIRLSTIRDWKKLTVRAVAERAGVNERTVYRYFGSERGLHDAVLLRNREEAGIELDGMRLGDVATVATRILDHVAQYPREPPPALDPTLVEAKDRQHRALLDAVASEVGRVSDLHQLTVAAVLDALWSVATYERLVDGWSIEHARAVDGIAWVIGLVEAAVRKGDGPPSHPVRPRADGQPAPYPSDQGTRP